MNVVCRCKSLLFSVSAMGSAGIYGFIHVCWELMGQDSRLGQQGDGSIRQGLKGRRRMKFALIPGRLLVAAWALGGDLDHLDTSWTVVFSRVLVAKLGRYRLGGWTAS